MSDFLNILVFGVSDLFWIEILKFSGLSGLGCKESIIATSRSFAAGIDIHAADGKNIIAVDNPALDIFHTTIAIQKILPATPMVSAHTLPELLVELKLGKLIHLLKNRPVAANFLEHRVKIAGNNLSSTQKRIGVFITKQ